MSTRRDIAIVAGREVSSRLNSKPYWISTALLCLTIIAVGVLNRALGNDGPTRYDVAVEGDIPAGFGEGIAAASNALGIDITLAEVGSTTQIVKGLRDGTFDVTLDPLSGSVKSKERPPADLLAAVSAAWQGTRSLAAARELGLNEAEIAAVLRPNPVEVVTIEAPKQESDDVGSAVGVISAVLLFMSLTFFGNYVLTGVIEEKSSGVIEVLLAHVRARNLLAGKVFGIGLMAIVQFTLALVAGAVALKIAKVSVPSSVWVGLPTTIIWFLGGFLLYSTLFALAGSFVSHQEDAQGASAPISILLSLAYFTVFAIGSNPDALAARIISVIPAFSPMLMPVRIAAGSASVGEVTLAVLLMGLAIWLMLRLAGSVYSRSLLHRGARLRWRQGLRLGRGGPSGEV